MILSSLLCDILTHNIFNRDEEHKNAHNYNFDSPNALDFDLAFEKILQLLRYEDVQIPVYDFATHSRSVNPLNESILLHFLTQLCFNFLKKGERAHDFKSTAIGHF